MDDNADELAIWLKNAGVHYEDLTLQLPEHPSKRWPVRSRPIERIYVCHSGSVGQPGYTGAHKAASEAILQNERKPELPGIQHQFWVPFESETGPTVYRCQPDGLLTAHTGGLADLHGIGVCVQGHHGSKMLSFEQDHALMALLDGLLELHVLALPDSLGWHSIADRWGGHKKASCPGRHLETWLTRFISSKEPTTPRGVRA